MTSPVTKWKNVSRGFRISIPSLYNTRRFKRSRTILIINDSYEKLLLRIVTLCGWSAKQTISLSVLVRNQTKDLDSRSPTRPEVGEEKEVREKPEVELEKEPREGSWRRMTVRDSRERTVERTGQDELAVQSGQRSA